MAREQRGTVLTQETVDLPCGKIEIDSAQGLHAFIADVDIPHGNKGSTAALHRQLSPSYLMRL